MLISERADRDPGGARDVRRRDEVATEPAADARRRRSVARRSEELTEAREVIEVQLAALAAERATPEQVEALRRATERMEAAAANPYEYPEADVEFHLALAEAAGNRYLLQAMVDIRALLRQDMELGAEAAIRRFGDLRPSVESHRRLLEAIGAATRAARPRSRPRSSAATRSSSSACTRSGRRPRPPAADGLGLASTCSSARRASSTDAAPRRPAGERLRGARGRAVRSSCPTPGSRPRGSSTGRGASGRRAGAGRVYAETEPNPTTGEHRRGGALYRERAATASSASAAAARWTARKGAVGAADERRRRSADYRGKDHVPSRARRWSACPRRAAPGAEVTFVVVITDPSAHFKLVCAARQPRRAASRSSIPTSSQARRRT